MPIPTTSSAVRSSRWWKSEEGQVHSTLIGVADHIRTTQSWQWDKDLFHVSMYSGGETGIGAMESVDAMDFQPARLARNVTRSAIQTFVAKVFKHRPLPEVLANKGNWRDQRRARKMTQLVEGEFDRDKIFKRWARLIGRDCGIFGRGVMKVSLDATDSKCPKAERVLPYELFVDTVDAKYGSPRNIYQITNIDVGVAVERFAPDDEELAERIIQSGRMLYDRTTDAYQTSTATVDRVRIVEAWHLCSDDDAHREKKKHDCDGRHCVSVYGGDLVDEPWEFDRFPFAVLNYDEPIEGLFGSGIAEALEGWQYEQNLMSEKVASAHYSAGGGIILNPTGSDIVAEDLTNDSNWKEIKHTPGMVPTFFSPEPLHPSTYQYLRDIGPDALAEIGVSQMSAQSTKPAGLNSGIALNTMDDIETERFVVQGYNYAQWCVEVAELYLMWISHIAKRDGDYTSRVPLRGGVLELSWKDVSVDNYVIQVQPASMLKLAPASRRQMALDLFNSGRIDGGTLMRYIGAGEADIDTEIETEVADRLLVDEQLEAMLDAEDPEDPTAYHSPNPYSEDIAWAKHRAQQRIARATLDGCPEGNLQLLRDYVLDCDSIQQTMAGMQNTPDTPMLAPGLPGTAANLPVPGGPPPGPPMPLPGTNGAGMGGVQ